MKARKWLITLAISAGLIAGGFAITGPLAPTPCLAAVCGPVGPTPPTPAGCRKLCPQCQCDSRGQNCHWIWYCCG